MIAARACKAVFADGIAAAPVAALSPLAVILGESAP